MPPKSTAPQHIIALEAQNVKRVKAVRIMLTGQPVFVIGGNNGQGKSSILDAITYTLAGGKAECERLIRNGEKSAKVVIETEDFIITKRWNEVTGATLTVTARDGAKYSSPQTILDGLVGRVCLDPLAFMRMDKKTQAAAMRKAIGVDTSELDAQRAGFYDQRTLVNRQHDAARAKSASATRYADVGTTEIPLKPIMDRLAAVNEVNDGIRKEQDAVAELVRALESDTAAVDAARAEVIRLEKALEAARLNVAMLEDTFDLAQRRAAIETERARVAALVPANSAEITKELETAQARNVQARANSDAIKLIGEAATLLGEAEKLTAKIAEIDAAKVELLAKAKLPVPGLSVTEDGVMLNGVPLSQASSAEQIRVSCAIGLSMNPTLKTLIVREGSLLDEASLSVLAEVAAESGAQIIMERVGRGKEVSVVIEDGEVVADAQGELSLDGVEHREFPNVESEVRS